MDRCFGCKTEIEKREETGLCPSCKRKVYESVSKMISAGFTDWGLRGKEVSQSEELGKKDDSDKLRLELLPPDAIGEIALVLTKGANKYTPRNWEKGIAYGRVYGALQRHLAEFWKGNDIDPEWGIHHLAHAGCCLLFLLSYELRGMKKWDDRLVVASPLAVHKEPGATTTGEPTL